MFHHFYTNTNISGKKSNRCTKNLPPLPPKLQPYSHAVIFFSPFMFFERCHPTTCPPLLLNLSSIDPRTEVIQAPTSTKNTASSAEATSNTFFLFFFCLSVQGQQRSACSLLPAGSQAGARCLGLACNAAWPVSRLCISKLPTNSFT